MTRLDHLCRLFDAERSCALWWRATQRPDLHPDAMERYKEAQRRAWTLAKEAA
jgi:hypothetical protein